MADVTTVTASIVHTVPYLTEEAVCPYCQATNTFRLLEGPISPVNPEVVCKHAMAYTPTNDGVV
ncbi:MAG: hypothetical protein KKB13_04290, partial [Chloroflexi bacterium]|nr:hypothetical protein [Chloroflexota bacterium]